MIVDGGVEYLLRGSSGLVVILLAWERDRRLMARGTGIPN